ncbi:MAG: hypothetical protein FLDDKLPJ_00739 [Phycisphaerae bacterium]|nr:hypothetical protein [Phycisphaerae bacterium]
MAHQSDNANRLTIESATLSGVSAMPQPDDGGAQVWLFALPYGRTTQDAERSTKWNDSLRRFALAINRRSIVAILTSCEDAAETWPHLADCLKFQLWVAVKLAQPIEPGQGQLANHHAALLVLSRYRTSLDHTKTRIEYSYCPSCDKSTKDYGGKKHTYHPYGTLVSDVWRDISYSPGSPPTEVATRLADLFGLPPYQRLTTVDCTLVRSLRPSRRPAVSLSRATDGAAEFKSRLVNADCLTALRAIPADSVDFCFADPPYNLDKRYDAWDDAIDVHTYLRWCNTWLDELGRIVRPGHTVAVLNIPLLAIRHFQHLKRNLRFQTWIVWEGLSLPVRFIMPAHYSIVCFSKGYPRPLPGIRAIGHAPEEKRALSALRENYCVRQACVKMREKALERDRERITDLWWDIHRLKHNSRRVDHPCQLPPALMNRLISLFTCEGEIVVDPFNGAGTTTLCAQSLGRRYVGIELSQKYHALAASRHRTLASGGDPFQKVDRVPGSKNSKVARIGGIDYKVPKKSLQLEVRRIARMLGRLPTREDVRQHAQYPLAYYDEYFISWGEVCAAARHAGMSETRGGDLSQLRPEEPTLFNCMPSQYGEASFAEERGAQSV